MNISYTEWMALGLLLVLLELMLPGVYLIWFGIASLGVALLSYFFPLELTEQLLSFSLLSVVFALIGVSVYQKIFKTEKSSDTHPYLNDYASQYIGRSYKLNEDVVDGKTKVLVGDTVWLAECDQPLLKGETVVVTAVKNGVILIVSSK